MFAHRGILFLISCTYACLFCQQDVVFLIFMCIKAGILFLTSQTPFSSLLHIKVSAFSYFYTSRYPVCSPPPQFLFTLMHQVKVSDYSSLHTLGCSISYLMLVTSVCTSRCPISHLFQTLIFKKQDHLSAHQDPTFLYSFLLFLF